MGYLSKWISAKHTPQSVALPGMVPNSAGAFAFPANDWIRLDRFLVLGSEQGSYYATEQTLTLENAEGVLRCLGRDGRRVVERVVAVSDAGRAPKNDPALFALALAAKLGDLPTRQAAFAALPRVARTGTHLFHFAEYVKALGGWGRATTRAFGRWYGDMPAKRLAFQAVKYQARDGWSHRDLLRKAHPRAPSADHAALYAWMVRGWTGDFASRPPADESLALIWAFERAKRLRVGTDVK